MTIRGDWHLALFGLILAGCTGGAGATSSTTPRSEHIQPVPASANKPFPHEQRTLTGHVTGSHGGYGTLIKVTDAQRSLAPGQSGVVLTLRGIGALHVTCAANPRSRVVLTAFAAGEGPPTILHDVAERRPRTSIAGVIGSVSGLTGQLGMVIPEAEASDHQVLEHWQISGGGEAFQFTAEITDLLTPTTGRCDLLAQATVVTHGPFYRYSSS